MLLALTVLHTHLLRTPAFFQSRVRTFDIHFNVVAVAFFLSGQDSNPMAILGAAEGDDISSQTSSRRRPHQEHRG